MDKLKELLDGLVAEKSLSFEVLQQLQKVKETSESILQENKNLGKSLDEKNLLLFERDTKILNLNATIADLTKELDAYKLREKEIKDFEHKQEISKLKEENAINRANEVKEIVSLVFKNPIIRETVSKSVTTPLINNGNGYPSTTGMSTTVNENETKETKQE